MLIQGTRNWYVRRVDAWKIFYEHVVTGGVEIIFGKFVTGVKEQPPAGLFADGSSMEADIVIGADGKQPKLSVTKDIHNIQVSTHGSVRHFSLTLRRMPSENAYYRCSCLHLQWMAILSRNNYMRTLVYSSGWRRVDIASPRQYTGEMNTTCK